jgi:hypothetical protein
MGANDWTKIAEAAEQLGVSEVWLRAWTRGKCGPELPSREIAGKSHVRPCEAYDHIRTHAKRAAPSLRPPPGYAPTVALDATPAPAAPAADPQSMIDPDIRRALGDVDPLSIDPHELMWKLVLAGMASEKIKTVVQVANSHQRKRDAAVRAGKSFPPDDVVRMCRSHGELLIEEVDAAAPRFAADLLRLLRESFGIDLPGKNPAAARIVEASIREQFGNGIIMAVRQRVDDQVHDVQALEFGQ